jgi:NIMA-interacting peptidyl-prolyl cis-trans isomerase 1
MLSNSKYGIGYRKRFIKKPVDTFEPPLWELQKILHEDAFLESYKFEGHNMEYLRIGKSSHFVFGRNSSTCQHAMNNPSISRMHAALIHVSEGIMLFDLFSSHGTFLNAQKINPGEGYLVWDSDIITFGASERKFRMKGVGMNSKEASKWLESREKNRQKQIALGEWKEENADDVNRFSIISTEATSNPKTTSKRQAVDSSSDDKSKRAKVDRVRVRHLLVKHRDSKNPTSWKEKNITRSKEEAYDLVLKYRNMIEKREVNFEDLAAKESDCSSQKRGGDLGPFGRGEMQRSFEECAFSMKVGELSHPVETNSGVHILLRLA